MSCIDNMEKEWLGKKVDEVDLGNGERLNTYYPNRR